MRQLVERSEQLFAIPEDKFLQLAHENDVVSASEVGLHQFGVVHHQVRRLRPIRIRLLPLHSCSCLELGRHLRPISK